MQLIIAVTYSKNKNFVFQLMLTILDSEWFLFPHIKKYFENHLRKHEITALNL